MLKFALIALLRAAIQKAQSEGFIPIVLSHEIELSEPKLAEHGDFATNYALIHAKSVGLSPRQLAETLLPFILELPSIQSAEIAGPGFINLRIQPKSIAMQAGFLTGLGPLHGLKAFVAKAAQNYIHLPPLPARVNLEFVSVNPNGPITVGSGRGAAYGDSLARILTVAGYNVESEFYINDALNSEQMRLFAESVKFYLAELAGKDLEFPEKGYKGDYVKAVAVEIHKSHLASFETPISELQEIAQEKMIATHKRDLSAFGVEYANWFSEQNLHKSGTVSKAIAKMEQLHHSDREPYRNEVVHEGKTSSVVKVEQTEGPLWLRSQVLGDDKDRVLVRADGRPAYIAGDLAYMEDKLGIRGYDKAMIILGPDHHGYIGRLNAVCKALDYKPSRFEVVIYQAVRFVRNGEVTHMRKRDGNIYELKDLVSEIGVDAARFFYLMRSHDTHMDFDIDLATKKTDENPVYYVQYAHARICSVIEKGKLAGFELKDGEGEISSETIEHLNSLDVDIKKFNLKWRQSFNEVLVHPAELTLIKKMCEYPEEVSRTVGDLGVHRLANYSIELARTFHNFYQACRVLPPEGVEPTKEGKTLVLARLALCWCCAASLKSVLHLLGVSAPEKMTREITEEPTLA